VRQPTGGVAVGLVDVLVVLLLGVGSRRRPVAALVLGQSRRCRQRRQREQQGDDDDEGSHGRLSIDEVRDARVGTTWCSAAERRQYAGRGRLTVLGRMKKWPEQHDIARGGRGMTERTDGATRGWPQRSASALAACLAAAALASLPAGAQAPYPQRPVMLIVPYGAGGIADTGMRIVADKLGARLGQQVVV